MSIMIDFSAPSSPESIVRLGIDEVYAVSRQRVTYIIIEWVTIEVTVIARDADQHRISQAAITEQNSVK